MKYLNLMENENKKKIKRKFINPIDDDDFSSYNFGSENLSPNIKALPVKKLDIFSFGLLSELNSSFIIFGISLRLNVDFFNISLHLRINNFISISVKGTYVFVFLLFIIKMTYIILFLFTLLQITIFQ